ncbi:hypothetical protein [Jiangella endophytica]|uniref:hypothetical protein n=1 Tax=Jiangella endophytica TaxID=1623398 RepID=UPI0018E57626|nr:hypothetical protein [Jiangella endophytica]
MAGLRLIEAHWRRVSEALRRPGVDLDPFAADLLTSAATAVLDAVTSEWSRSGGDTDRAALLDRGFAVVRPGVSR